MILRLVWKERRKWIQAFASARRMDNKISHQSFTPSRVLKSEHCGIKYIQDVLVSKFINRLLKIDEEHGSQSRSECRMMEDADVASVLER